MAEVQRLVVPRTQLQAAPVPDTSRRNSLLNNVAFGAAEGGAVAEAGGHLNRLGLLALGGAVALQERQNAIHTSESEGQYKAFIQETFHAVDAGPDGFSDPETLKEFATTLNTKREELIASYKGTGTGRLILQERLNERRDAAQEAAVTRSWQAATAKIDRNLSNELTDLKQRAYEHPEEVAIYKNAGQRALKVYEAALSPEKLDLYHKTINEQIPLGAIQKSLDIGNWQDAKTLRDTYKGDLTTPVLDAVNDKINRFENQAVEHLAKAKSNLALAEQVLGKADFDRLDAEKKLNIANMHFDSQPKAVRTKEQEFSDIIRLKGIAEGNPNRTATPEEVNAFFGMSALNKKDGEPKTFDELLNSRTGRAEIALMHLRPAIASGMATRAQMSEYFAALREYDIPTDQFGTKRELPPDDKRILRTLHPDKTPREVLYGEAEHATLNFGPTSPSGARVAAAPTAVPSPSAELPEVGQARDAASAELRQQRGTAPLVDAMAPVEAYIAQYQGVKDKSGTGMFAKSVPIPPLTIFGVADKLTGPVPTWKAFAGDTIGLSMLTDKLEAAAVTQAQSFFRLFKVNLISSLRTGDKRFTDTEREEIIKRLNIEPSMFETVDGFRQKLLGLGIFLERKREGLEMSLRSGKITADQRGEVADTLDFLSKTIAVLGMPPLFNSDDAARTAFNAGQLPFGALYRTPDPDLPDGGRLKQMGRR